MSTTVEKINYKVKDITLADWGRKEIELAERISALGLSRMTVQWGEAEQVSLMKSYVEGKTLRGHLLDDPEFNLPTYQPDF